jgi:hypothetical protein
MLNKLKSEEKNGEKERKERRQKKIETTNAFNSQVVFLIQLTVPTPHIH